VRTDWSVARIAASDRAFPASVPPMPPVSASSMLPCAADPIRHLSRHSVDPAAGTPLAIGLPSVSMSGLSPNARV